MKYGDFVESGRTDSARRRNPHLHPSYIIPVLGKALVIMEVLKSSELPLNVDELARITGIAKSTVYRILRTLSAYGYLPDGADGIYSFRHVPHFRQDSVGAGERLSVGDPYKDLIPAAVARHLKGNG